MAQQHETKGQQLAAWIAEKDTYLQQREDCDTETMARFLLGVLEAYQTELATLLSTDIVSFQQLGQQILSRKYATTHSSYVYEAPESITGREAGVHATIATLNELATAKQPFLQDHLERTQFQDQVGRRPVGWTCVGCSLPIL